MIWPFRRRERITAAAVQINGYTFSLLPPARHAECLWLMHAIFPTEVYPERQGFLTDRQRFVGREEGKLIAARAGQLLPTHSSSQHLFSEDLW